MGKIIRFRRKKKGQAPDLSIRPGDTETVRNDFALVTNLFVQLGEVMSPFLSFDVMPTAEDCTTCSDYLQSIVDTITVFHQHVEEAYPLPVGLSFEEHGEYRVYVSLYNKAAQVNNLIAKLRELQHQILLYRNYNGGRIPVFERVLQLIKGKVTVHERILQLIRELETASNNLPDQWGY